jgi:hypothetical protein
LNDTTSFFLFFVTFDGTPEKDAKNTLEPATLTIIADGVWLRAFVFLLV